MTIELKLTLSAILTAFVLTYFFLPSIIKVAKIKHLFDSPGDRKLHKTVVPTLGGVGIFGGFLISFCLFGKFNLANEVKYIIAALCFIFMLGAKDDIVELVPTKKFIGQIFAAAVIVILGGIRISSLYGLFGITMLSDFESIVLSMVTIIFIINSFNLIDGINLLAGSIGVLVCVAFGSWFYFYGFYDYAILCAAVIGALIAFLYFNKTPAQIFMGDSGSLSIGLLISILAIQFIEKNELVLYSQISSYIKITASPAMAIAILIIPIYDAFRVFSLRILNKKSPFSGDRNHIHHRLIDLGFSHEKSTFILILVNLFFIISAYFLQPLGNFLLIIFIYGLAVLLTLILFLFKIKTKETIKNKEVNVPYNVEISN